VPNDGCLEYLDDNDNVLVAGFGRSGHAVGDLPGVRFKVVKVAGVSLKALYLVYLYKFIFFFNNFFLGKERKTSELRAFFINHK
jgi:hypothetical protein